MAPGVVQVLQQYNKTNALMSLPTSLIHCILSDWLKVASVIRLDFSFFRNESFQLQLHDILKSDEFYLKEVKPTEGMYMWGGPSSPEYLFSMTLDWLFLNSTKVLYLEVHHSCARVCVGKYLQRFGEHVRGVCLHTAEQIIPFEKHCHNLTAFVLYNCTDCRDCERIFVCNPNLESLYIKRGYWKVPLYSHPPLIMHKLRQLTWSAACRTGDVLVSLVKATPNLLQLSLSQTVSKDMDGDVIMEVAQSCPHLRTFNCKRLHIGPSDSYLKQFLETCKCIVNLDVRKHVELTDTVLIAALEGLVGVKSLNLCGCTRLTDRTLDFLAQRFASTLQVLHLDYNCLNPLYWRQVGQEGGFTAAGIATLRAQCTQLRTFHYTIEASTVALSPALFVEACLSATVVKIRSEDALPMILKHCRQMQILVLPINQTSIRVRLTVEQILSIAAHCPCLRTIILEEAMFDDKLDYSAVRKAYPKLRFTRDMTLLDFDVFSIPV